MLPNEESTVVNTRVFFISSEDAFCNWTSEIITAGRKSVIELGYNMSVSLLFSFNGSEVVYNVFTFDSAEEYEPEDVEISLAEHQEFLIEVAVVCAGFGAIAVMVAFPVRSRTE